MVHTTINHEKACLLLVFIKKEKYPPLNQNNQDFLHHFLLPETFLVFCNDTNLLESFSLDYLTSTNSGFATVMKTFPNCFFSLTSLDDKNN